MQLIPELKQAAISQLAKGVLGARLWNDVRMFVKDSENLAGLSNAEKHAKVKKDLRVIFGDVFECVLDAAISVAVMWLRSKAA